MIAVIAVPGPNAAMHGLDEHTPTALLPLGDRPILQHLIELMLLQGIRSFELLVQDKLGQIETHLGDGTRWGCTIRYRLCADPGHPFESLRVIPRLPDNSWILLQADRFPYLPLDSYFRESAPVFVFGANGDGNGSAPLDWTGAALFPCGFDIKTISQSTFEALANLGAQLIRGGFAHSVIATTSVDARTPAALLESQRRLLSRDFPNLMINGVEGEHGVRISRNVIIHPSAQIVPPVYIGPNSRIARASRVGPHVVLSANCIVDANTTIEHSLIAKGSYIGQRLELNHVIVDRNLLVNTKLGTAIVTKDEFLLGGTENSNRRGTLHRMADSLVAIFLLVSFSPLLIALLLWTKISRNLRWTFAPIVRLPSRGDVTNWTFYRLPFIERSAWETTPSAGWESFLLRFLPGLMAVAGGKLALVGLPPRTREQIAQLPEDWRSLYLAGEAGLITEASILPMQNPNETETYFAEACYSATASTARRLELTRRYLLRLLSRPRPQDSIGPEWEA